MLSHYDLIVLGGGPGGYVAAIKGAQAGLQVALIERDKVGGTCLNRGCIPTKTLMHTTSLLHEIEKNTAAGLCVADASIDFAALIARRDAVSTQLRDGIEGLLKANKVELIRGEGSLSAPGEISVNGETITYTDLILAVGSRPAIPPIEGIRNPGVYTSDDLLEGEGKQFQKLVIIGGGVIGIEFASIYAALGCEVTIVEALDRCLANLDREISQNATMLLKKRGIAIHTGAMVKAVGQQENGLVVRFEQKDQTTELPCDGVLVAVGRRSNTDGCLAQGIDLGLERGMIPVSEQFETKIVHIYAIGDIVKGGIQLAHVASAQGIAAVDAICGKKPSVNLSAIPACVYSDPEIATVGISADEAKAAGISVKTGKFIMSANGKSMIELADRGFIKVVADEATGVVLGAQMMCTRATDMICEFADAVANKLTIEQMASVIRPHPTFCEGISEAVEAVDGNAVHIMPSRR